MAKKTILSAEDHARIVEAVRSAEKKTSGEIYCVVAQQSDSYFFPSAFFSALIIMITMVPAAIVTGQRWDAAHPAVLPASGLAALATALVLLWMVPELRPMLVPRSLRYRRASANAVAQFMSHNIHITAERTGVLIFVSLQERYAEIVADSGINAKVDQKSWDGAIATLTEAASRGSLVDGFVSAIMAVGGELERHFPPGRDGSNELADHLVEI